MNSFHEFTSLAQFKARYLLELADSEIVKRGRSYFSSWNRCRLLHFSAEDARYTVRGTRDYKVEIFLEDGEFAADCDCPHSHGDTNTICKHKIAAALHLENHLRFNPLPDWRSTLETILSGKSKKSADNFLLFSLQSENTRWSVVPYQLPAYYFSDDTRREPEQIKQIILDQNLTQFAKKVAPPSYWNDQSFINLELKQKSLLKLFANGYGLGSYGFNFETFIGLLGDVPFFRGSTITPFKYPLKIYYEAGRIEFNLQRTGDELSLRSVVVLGAAEDRVQLKIAEILSQNPLWLIAGKKIFGLSDSAYIFEKLKANANLKVPAAEEVFFWEKFLPNLAENYQISGEAIKWQDLDYEQIAPRLYLKEKGELLQIELRFGYAHLEITPEKNPAPDAIRRDADSGVLYRFRRDLLFENDCRELLGEARFGTKRTTDANLFLLRAKIHPFDFLTKYVPLLAAEGFEIFGEEALKNVRVNKNRPTISFGITSGIDWFDLDAVVQFGDVAVSLKDFRKAVRKKERFIKLTDGSIGEIPPEWLEKYKHLFGLGAESGEKLRFDEYHLTLLDQLFDNDQAVRADREVKAKLEKLKNFENIKERKLPKSFVGELRPYQKHGFDWLYFLHEYGFGGCLADDMGTGKTVQVLAFLQSLKEKGVLNGGNLLIVPRSLVFNWQREAAKFTPDLKILDYSTPDRTTNLEDFDDYDLVVSTYALIWRDIEKLVQREYNYVILDEAQAVKNPLAETGKAVRLLRAKHRLTMTGTPVENNTLELWSQFAFLNPGFLGSADYFRESFTNPIEKKSDENSVKVLRRMIHPFVLRRTKEQVAPDLPPRTERQIFCEPDEKQRKFYLEKRDHYRALLLKMVEDKGLEKSRFQVLEGLLRLRQICNHPILVEKSYTGKSAKLEMLLETIETLQSEGHKALIFSQFVQMLKLIEKELKARKIPYSYLDGKTKNREEKVDEFQNDPNIPFFLISLKAGGVGLNLTAADYVLHVDPWWNPAVEQQATDRTHRIGQDKPVFVYKFVLHDSVEEKILTLQERKRNLSSQLISTEASFFKSLTAADIKNLFS